MAPTYKRVKGFQPLQVTWGRLLIDPQASNHGHGPEDPESSDSEDSKVPLRRRSSSAWTAAFSIRSCCRSWKHSRSATLSPASWRRATVRWRKRRGVSQLRSGTMWNWETELGPRRALFCRPLMRTGSAPLPAPIRSWVAAAPWKAPASGAGALASSGSHSARLSGTGSRRVSASSPEGLCLDSSLQTLCSQRGLLLHVARGFFPLWPAPCVR